MSAKRPLNDLETKLHQAALSAPNNELSVKQAESIVPDPSARQNALNFLLGVGLFKSLIDAKGVISFRAVTKSELTATKDLGVDENLVLSHIGASKNEGIWTKHLKSKTNLHQTVIDRCLKTLTQKRLIKRVPSVQYPTRKIYMLEGLDPSISLTGGPWYTDNELDLEFIQHLSGACLKFIRDLTFPRPREGSEFLLYGLSNAPRYPGAEQIRHSLRKARLTETDLSVEHVESLLNVLVLDGEIERLPALGPAMWDAKIGDDLDDDSDSQRSGKKRKRRKDDDDSGKRKRSRKSHSGEEESDSDDTSRKKSKRKRPRADSDGEDDSDGETLTRKKKKSRRKGGESSNDSDERSSHKKKSRKSKSKKLRDSSSSDSGSSDDESDRSSRRSKSAKKLKRQSPPLLGAWDGGGGYVYRAIKPERLYFGLSDAPCSRCPSFDFCKDGGPVNPKECVYYGDWLSGKTIASVEDGL